MARKYKHKFVVLFSIIYLVDVWLKENKLGRASWAVLPTDVAKCHQDSDFFHNLSHLMLPLGSYAFASDLPMPYRVKSYMHCSERTGAKAL